MIVCVANQKGGTGKTTLAVNLAHHLNADIVVDGDKQRNISQIFKLKNEDSKYRILTIDEFCQIEFDDNDVIVVDCGGYDSDVQRNVLANADFIITPTSDSAQDQLGLWVFDKILADINHATGRNQKAMVVLNRTHPNRRNFDDFRAMISNLQNCEFSGSVIPSAADAESWMFKGEAVKRGPTNSRFKQLASQISEVQTA